MAERVRYVFSHKDRQAEWTTHGYLSEQAARTSGEHAYGDDYVVWRITMTAELVVEGQPC